MPKMSERERLADLEARQRKVGDEIIEVRRALRGNYGAIVLDLAVETLTERENLMFRIRVRVPPDLAKARADQVKTGVRGVVWVRWADPDGHLPSWPVGLTPPLIDLPATAGADTP